jgi:hypothetical protein
MTTNLDWIGDRMRRNCVLKQVIKRKVEGKIGMEGRRRRRRRSKELLNNLKTNRGCWKLIEEAIYHIVCRTGFGRGNGYVVGQTK